MEGTIENILTLIESFKNIIDKKEFDAQDKHKIVVRYITRIKEEFEYLEKQANELKENLKIIDKLRDNLQILIETNHLSYSVINALYQI